MARRIMYIPGSGDVVSGIGGSGLCGLWSWRLGDLWFVVFAVLRFVVCGICGSGICGFAGVCRSLPGANSKMQEYQGKC